MSIAKERKLLPLSHNICKIFASYMMRLQWSRLRPVQYDCYNARARDLFLSNLDESEYEEFSVKRENMGDYCVVTFFQNNLPIASIEVNIPMHIKWDSYRRGTFKEYNSMSVETFRRLGVQVLWHE